LITNKKIQSYLFLLYNPNEISPYYYRVGEPPFDYCINELKIAAYLNYINIVFYRQFRFSPSVLRIYNRYIEIGAIKKFYKGALEIINNLDLDRLNRYGNFKK
jgi:hypothetical protein